MPPKKAPGLRPAPKNTPEEIQEAVDSSREVAQAMEDLYKRMSQPDVWEGSDDVNWRKMEITTDDGKKLTLYMSGQHSVQVSSENESLKFFREGDFFSLAYADRPGSTPTEEDLLYKYDPSTEEGEGDARQYSAAAKTFLDLIENEIK